MAGQLTGKVAIVTGAASGIGEAIALAFDREGASLVLVDRDAVPLATMAKRLAAAPAIRVADVTDAAAMETVVADALTHFGRVTTVVTAAAVSYGKQLTESEIAEWEQTFAVNVIGVANLVKPAIPRMIEAGGGSIITLASQLAVAGGRNNCAYVASKGAVISMTKSIAIDYAGDGIRANAILPGATETPMLQRAFARRGADAEAARAASQARHAMRRFGRAEEIAAAAVFLASDASSFVTGVTLPVDGGWLAA